MDPRFANFPNIPFPQDFSQPPAAQRTAKNKSVLYKTQLCRKFAQTGYCRYGNKCQFAHGVSELRSVSDHPLYKTAKCNTFRLTGICPYGKRCRFIHERQPGHPIDPNSTDEFRTPDFINPTVAPKSAPAPPGFNPSAPKTAPAAQPPAAKGGGDNNSEQGTVSPLGVADLGIPPAAGNDSAALRARLEHAQVLLRAQAKIQSQLEVLNLDMQPRLDHTTAAIEQAARNLSAQTLEVRSQQLASRMVMAQAPMGLAVAQPPMGQPSMGGWMGPM